MFTCRSRMQISSAFGITLDRRFNVLLAAREDDKMSSGVRVSPCHAINKTRNAILRLKKCSPELRMVLRQKCQERIHGERLKALNTFRKIKIQDSFRVAFGNILNEEWKSIEEDNSSEPICKDLSQGFNLDDELVLEELLEKELICQHEQWLLQLYEELLNEDADDSNDIVCPLCCSGYLEQIECDNYKRTSCTKCPGNFVVEKSLRDLQAAIYGSLALHDKQCSHNSSFVNIPKNENENSLCIVCHHCSHLNVIG